MNRQDACSTRVKLDCGTGILPVAEETTRILPVVEACSTRVKFDCGTGILPVAKEKPTFCQTPPQIKCSQRPTPTSE
ncbi:hypothetical protein QUB08_18765 [Microcoleus sp. BR0-C5]|uniref:hypothetical protein n=1 Tax=Microcoleus sp. BR0-C5 TaxID=2818713 RepID=UPI002FD6A357